MKQKKMFWLFVLSLGLGAVLSLFQGSGWLGFSTLTFFALLLFNASLSWLGNAKLLVIVALAFVLRLAGGVALYEFLPVYGYDDADDEAGYIFTDAHKRDEQAWGLASSGKSLFDAFSGDYSSDQYGGLLGLSALVYRYLSPDVHRPLLMVLMAAFVAALGIPFLWRATRAVFGEQVAWVVVWIFALYPESVLLGGAAMREPYLMSLSAIAFWGFLVGVQVEEASHVSKTAGRVALGLSLFGMLLLSPSVLVFTLVLFAGWMFFSRERFTISWQGIVIFALVFMLGVFVLSSTLDRNGVFESNSPLAVLNRWLELAVNWNVYQIERESGWIQKLFDEMPEGLRLPFVAVYGMLQPVLPAAMVVPTLPIWKIIYVARALGWYVLLPALILSFVTGSSLGVGKKRSLVLWLALLVWTWILLAALRGGGDQWDNPRYRTIMFIWQALVAGQVWVWWRETRNVWMARVLACEAVFVLVFGQWYASRYFYVGGQLPFAVMVGLIMGLWGVIVVGGWWFDRRRGM